MAKKKALMKGNHALAEAAVRAGVTFFAGYPITPQSEILEYLSWRLPEAGGKFIQTESELSGISMVHAAALCGARVLTSSSGPGFDLMQEGIGYATAAETPLVIIDVTRYACGIGGIQAAQGDYWQLAKNGAHGDYKVVVLTPGSLQEAVDFIPMAYDIAEKYRNPVIVAVDGSIAQMVEAVSLPDEITKHDMDAVEWAAKGANGKTPKAFVNGFILNGTPGPVWTKYLNDKYNEIKENEARYAEYETEDADVTLVAYGTTSRLCREAVIEARKQGIKLGLVRPQTIWPFPVEAFKKNKPAKGYLTVELCDMPQMYEDVLLASRCTVPVYTMVTGRVYPSVKDIIAEAQKIINGEAKEV